MAEIWKCQHCDYKTKNENMAIKHSKKIVFAQYHNLKLEEE